MSGICDRHGLKGLRWTQYMYFKWPWQQMQNIRGTIYREGDQASTGAAALADVVGSVAALDMLTVDIVLAVAHKALVLLAQTLLQDLVVFGLVTQIRTAIPGNEAESIHKVVPLGSASSLQWRWRRSA